MHLVVPIVREHGFTNVRRAALALAREVTRRAPGVATAAWWKEERQGVFVDYNQNARDRTVASVYSVRPVPDARVATPLSWDEVADVDPSVFTITTVPERLASIGDPGAGADPDERSSLAGLLELAAKDGAGGPGDAPKPPNTRRAIASPCGSTRRGVGGRAGVSREP
jgi:DNA primase